MSKLTEKQLDFQDFSNISSSGGPVWHLTKDCFYFISNKEEYFQIYQLDINQPTNIVKLTNTENRTTVPMISSNGVLYYL